MRILVTGSSGRIGRAIAARLLRRHEVVGYDSTPASVTSIVADVNDEAALMKAMRGMEAVIHTASLHAPHVPYVPESRFEQVNVAGASTLLKCCASNGVKNLVYTSTTALYGSAATPEDHAGWVTEDTVPAPKTIYHRTKLKAESALRAAAAEGAVRVTVLRMSRCFPEPAPLMAAYRLHRGVDARDVASAHELALMSNERPFRLFIVSGDTPFAPEDVQQLKTDAPAIIKRRSPGLAQAFAARGWRLPQAIDRVYSNAAARADLGWQPRFGYEDVLRQLDEDSSEVLPPTTDWEANE